MVRRPWGGVATAVTVALGLAAAASCSGSSGSETSGESPTATASTASCPTATASATASAASAAHSAPQGISAYFVMPAATPCANASLLLSMQADAITFGYRVLPASPSTYPAAVRQLVGSRTAYDYTGGGDWAPAALRPTDHTTTVAGVTWTVMDTGGGTVVVSRSGDDRLKALNTAGNRLGAKTIVGLPAPRAGSQDRVTYLPDTSYLPTLAQFTKRFVADAAAEGADGFYQHVEMPVTDTATWAPVRSLYAVQHAAVNATTPGALVVVSPYLESRTGRAGFTPAQAGRGARLILDTASGTRLLIAPQDGLGVGTAALRGDGAAGRVAPLEDYLRAMRDAVGVHLWSNVELMRPGGGDSRVPTTEARVSQQLSAESP
ncbi:MAG TPA: hypothetical protein VFJ94_14540, partial [Intrasporangium sp.]|uniref:hypothetical protein n=1 Tax=Intrasporangium sp. TaxID=1925024 RepID=UPI002D79E299